jgi:hypothetical protein
MQANATEQARVVDASAFPAARIATPVSGQAGDAAGRAS